MYFFGEIILHGYIKCPYWAFSIKNLVLQLVKLLLAQNNPFLYRYTIKNIM